MEPSSSDLRTSFLKSKLGSIPHLPAYAPNSPQAKAASESLAKAQSQGLQQGDDDDRATQSRAQESKPRNLLEADYSPLSAQDCFQQALEIDVVYPLPSKIANLENKATFRVYYSPPNTKKGRKSVKKSNPFPSPFQTSAPISSNSTSASASSTSIGLQLPKPQDETLASLSLPTSSRQQDDVDDAEDSNQDQDVESEGSKEEDQSPGTVFVLHHGAGYSALSYALCAKEISKMTDGEAGVLAFDCRGHGE